jgi:hypothetical protein
VPCFGQSTGGSTTDKETTVNVTKREELKTKIFGVKDPTEGGFVS